MSHATKQHGADPWWGLDDSVAAPPPVDRPRPGGGAARRRRSRAARRDGVGWILLGLLVAPLDRLGRLVRRSPRLRRLLLRAGIVLAVLTMLASSVGVILINNVVIGRTAELGELEDRRRDLRRENAVLGARAARLESPELVRRLATERLGMVPTSQVPEFVYLFDGSRTITPMQRRRIAERATRRREAAEAAGAAEGETGSASSASAAEAVPEEESP